MIEVKFGIDFKMGSEVLKAKSMIPFNLLHQNAPHDRQSRNKDDFQINSFLTELNRFM